MNHILGKAFAFLDIMFGLMETVYLPLDVVNMHALENYVLSILLSKIIWDPHTNKTVEISPKDTVYLEFLQLLIGSDNTSACVKPLSIDKLMEHGFTIVQNNNKSPYN